MSLTVSSVTLRRVHLGMAVTVDQPFLWSMAVTQKAVSQLLWVLSAACALGWGPLLPVHEGEVGMGIEGVLGFGCFF